MAMLDYQRVGESETTLEYDCWLLGKGPIGSKLVGVNKFPNHNMERNSEFSVTGNFFSLDIQGHLLRRKKIGPLNTSVLKAFRGSKHLLTRYLEDFGRLGFYIFSSPFFFPKRKSTPFTNGSHTDNTTGTNQQPGKAMVRSWSGNQIEAWLSASHVSHEERAKKHGFFRVYLEVQDT